MFLFNSLHSGSMASKNLASGSPASGSLRRNPARSVFTLAVMFCLLTAFLFTGCTTDDEYPVFIGISFIPVGEWADDYGSGYNITASSLEYYTADTEWGGTTYPGESIKGGIKEVINFSSDAGVLLVQITESTTAGQAGKFIGVYYKDYTASHVFLANAIDGSSALILKNTLAEAKNTFTVDNVDTHVAYWGSGYGK